MENETFNLSAIDDMYNNYAFRYRINAFAKACGIEKTDFEPYKKSINKTDGAHNYNIKSKYYIENGYQITNLIGQYDNLSFSFVNLIRPDDTLRINSENVQLKFAISLKIVIDGYIYKLDINPESSLIDIIPDLWKYGFKVNKVTKDGEFCDEIKFSSEIYDFNKVLKIVEMFVRNPQALMEIYDELTKSKKVFPNFRIASRLINKDKEKTGKVKRI